MAVNKLIVNDEVKLDLTSDTVNAESLLSGVTAHDASGAIVTGTVSTVTVYSGTEEPSSSLGAEGDIYLVLEE